MFSCLTAHFCGQEIFSLDKIWFHDWAQNTFIPLVWHLLHQNILITNDFMKVYEKLIIFIKSLKSNIFWWKKCQTIGLKVFWVDLQNQNLSKINISCQTIFESDINNQRKMTGSMRISLHLLLPYHKTQVCLWCFDFTYFHLYFATWNIFWQEILILDKFWFRNQIFHKLS